MSRQIVEQVQCDQCGGVVERPLAAGPKGTRAEQGPIPDGWVAVIRRYTEQSEESGPIAKKIDNIYCSPRCAIRALERV